VVVPNIVGLSEGQAQEFLERVGLQPVFGGSRNDDAFSSGLVLDQAVPPGQPLAVGQNVTYTLSLGPQLVTVSNLTNAPVDIARQQAEELGLIVEVVNAPSQSVGEGLVISHDPAAGAQVPPGTLMRLDVSIGDKVRFPDVIGGNSFQAGDIIKRTNGLNLEYVHEQGRDILGAAFDQFQPYEVVSARANGQPVQNGDFVPRGSNIVLGVRAP
jgi:serine/threonine-protein kinase